MDERNDTLPVHGKNKFTCPHCHVLAHQNWGGMHGAIEFNFSKCVSCLKTSIWLKRKMIYPTTSSLPRPNKDLDEEIKTLYQEARCVYPISPRAAAALLRLCVEKLCTQIGVSGPLNEQIKNLVEKGVPIQIQQALDYCRVIGNHAVHPGKIDIEDEPNRVTPLFNLINDIAQEMITKPKEINEKYASLPLDEKSKIEKRDANQ